MKKKVGVNKPCPCGSGKKYKKCCRRMNESGWYKVPPEEQEDVRKMMEEQNKKPEKYMQLVPAVMHQGHKFRAIWNKVYPRPPQETFHEFIMNMLIETLGKEWWLKQKELKEAQQHVIVKWHASMVNTMEAERTKENQVGDREWSIQSTGHIQSFLQLSYDCFVLQQVDRLPESLLDRLRNHRGFQGARYEIGVAAMFARAGFEIEFIEEEEGKKICEFIAKHKSGLDIAVEAKSRHRPGVLNEKGKMPDNVTADFRKLYADARKKKPEMQYVIFIDANLPPAPDVPIEKAPWLADVRGVFDKFPTPSPENPDPHTAVVITNYGFYYSGSAPSAHHACLYIISLHPKYPQTHPDAWSALWETTERYTHIPREV